MSVFVTLRQYLRGAQQEFKRVQWPNRPQFVRSFMVVVVGVAITTGVVMLIDAGLTSSLKYLLQL